MKYWIWYVLGAGAVVLMGGTLWYALESREVVVPADTTPVATSTEPVVEIPVEKPTLYAFKLASGDTVSSWSFKGLYTGNAELTQKATSEIARLKAIAPSREVTEYELYISIANQYHWLGDGENTLLYLRKALAVDADLTGLAWNNLGALAEEVGAYHTALAAYKNAAQVQPIPQYQAALEDFRKAHPEL